MELLKCTGSSGLLLQGPRVWSCCVVPNSSWLGCLRGNSGAASCQFPPEAGALSHWLQCQPLGKICRELGMLPSSGSICLPAQLSPAASGRDQLIHSMESASLPTHESPCPSLSRKQHTELSRGNMPQIQTRGLAPTPGKAHAAASRRDVKLLQIKACTSATDISATP